MLSSPVAGFAYAQAAPAGQPPLARYLGVYLVGFIVYFLVYQVLTWRAFGSADPEQLVRWVRATAPRTRHDRRLVFWTGSSTRSWAATAAMLALVAVAAVLVSPSLRAQPAVLVPSLLIVVTGWLMVVCAFAVAYLRLDVEDGGFEFPAGDRPVFSDYVYLAVQVTATYASSDVTLTTAAARRLVTNHTLLAFVFNTVIVALLVSALVTLAG